MYEKFKKLLDSRGVTPYRVSISHFIEKLVKISK